MYSFPGFAMTLTLMPVLVAPAFAEACWPASEFESSRQPMQNQAEDGSPDPRQVRPEIESRSASMALTLESESGEENGQPRRRGGVQTKVENGVRTISVVEPERDIQIVEDPRTGIIVTLVRRYGPQDEARLKSRHPELADYVEMFPREIGDHQVELNLTITSTFRARTSAQLQTKHPEAFNLYRRYRKAR